MLYDMVSQMMAFIDVMIRCVYPELHLTMWYNTENIYFWNPISKKFYGLGIKFRKKDTQDRAGSTQKSRFCWVVIQLKGKILLEKLQQYEEEIRAILGRFYADKVYFQALPKMHLVAACF